MRGSDGGWWVGRWGVVGKGAARLAKGVCELGWQRALKPVAQRRIPHGELHRERAEVHRVRGAWRRAGFGGRLAGARRRAANGGREQFGGRGGGGGGGRGGVLCRR